MVTDWLQFNEHILASLAPSHLFASHRHLVDTRYERIKLGAGEAAVGEAISHAEAQIDEDGYLGEDLAISVGR